MTDLITFDIETAHDSLDMAVVTVTPSAAGKIRELLGERSIPNHFLRVFVTATHGAMQYGMAFEAAARDYDLQIEAAPGVCLLVDPRSAQLIGGASIDFVDTLMGGGFRIDNPNAVTSCACGTSSDGCGCNH